MLRFASLLAVLLGSFLTVSAITVPTTYCDSAKDLINIPGQLEADVWPPALGSKITFQLSADVDSVIMHSSFRVNETATPVDGVTTLTLDIPSGAHTGLYQFNIHGTKNDAEVYCIEAKWSLTSTPEDRGTDQLWNQVTDRIKTMNSKREQILRDARENAPANLDSSKYIEQFDAEEVHAHMLRTHDEVHARYPHMMANQRVRHEQLVEDGAQAQ